MTAQSKPTSEILNPIRALILDDEIEACRNLEILLSRYWSNSIEIVGIAQSTEDAEKIIHKMKPEVLFIDIEMPRENAFHFLERIDRTSFEIIFVTAYDEYALRALKLNAIDYILKPISLDEVEEAIKKLKEKVLMRQMTLGMIPVNNISNLAEQFTNKKPIENLVLRTKTELLLLDFKEIIYIEAIGSYTNFHFVKDGNLGQMVMSHPLTEYEELLPSSMFFRIHKTFLINTIYVKKIIKEEQHQLEMSFDILLPISRRRHQSFIEFLKYKS